MSESNMRSLVVKALRGLHPIPVENPIWPGTPDVNCICGWIELKELDDWPVRATTPVRIEHYTKVQRVWATNRWAFGGKAYFLLKVKREWLLFGREAPTLIGKATRLKLTRNALATWVGNAAMKEGLRKWLLQNCR